MQNENGATVEQLPMGESQPTDYVHFRRPGFGSGTRDFRETKEGFEKSSRDYTNSVLQGLSAGAPMFPTVEAGISGTAEGEFFNVPGGEGGGTYQTLYRHDPQDTATFVSSGPSSAYVAGVDRRVQEVRAALARYVGDEQLVPLYIDAAGRVLIGVNRSDGTVFVAGQLDTQSAKRLSQETLGEGGMAAYIGGGPIYPIVTDAAGRVLIGVEKGSGDIVGSFKRVPDGPSAPDVPIVDKLPKKSINQIVFYGQSLSVGAAAGSLISVTQPYSNVTFSGGPRAWNGSDWDFGPFKPLVEDEVAPAPDGSSNRKETPCSGAANYASTALALSGVSPDNHVILASAAGRGGYRIDQLEKGAAWYNNLIAHINGAHDLETDHALNAVCWLQGENDVVASTDGDVYKSKLAQLRKDVEIDAQEITSQASPVYLLTYQLSYGARTHPAIALAQLGLARDDAHVFLAAPTYHIPHATDNVHLTAIGYKWIGAYFGRAYSRIVLGLEPQWLQPISATIRGAIIRVRFSVPTLPLVLDIDRLAATTDFGFKVLSNGQSAQISAVVVDGADVLIHLPQPPDGDVLVRYGLDYIGQGLTITNGGSGNLRDSSTDTISIAGDQYPLWNVCPHFEMPAIALGE